MQKYAFNIFGHHVRAAKARGIAIPPGVKPAVLQCTKSAPAPQPLRRRAAAAPTPRRLDAPARRRAGALGGAERGRGGQAR